MLGVVDGNEEGCALATSVGLAVDVGAAELEGIVEGS